MLSIGLPNDEDSQGEEAPCCRKCGHEMGQDWYEEWYCLGCEPKPEDEE